ncbi:hypothetical protein [Streptomyces cinnamoneus]|uniref:hypothetical protein n=1 Tax=Streptomyces cinnamoneus TaxID=53446 RepID=UPI001865A31E|nr:hypothetical protein [Streptomyces cinnamoneus]
MPATTTAAASRLATTMTNHPHQTIVHLLVRHRPGAGRSGPVRDTPYARRSRFDATAGVNAPPCAGGQHARAWCRIR